MTEDDVSRLSDEDLRSLASRTQQELSRREDLLKESIRAAFDARLAEEGLSIADIYPECNGPSQSDKKRGARVIARALFRVR